MDGYFETMNMRSMIRVINAIRLSARVRRSVVSDPSTSAGLPGGGHD
jgi:hypothetical protein